MKKLLALLCVLAMLVSFAGCNPDTPEPSASTPVGSNPGISVAIEGAKQFSLQFGTSKQLSAKAVGGEVAWEIDGETLGSTISATGLFIAGNEEGMVTVRAYIVGNEEVFDSCTITLSEEPVIEPPAGETISIDGAEALNLGCGVTHQFTATVSTGAAVWSIDGDALGCTISADGLLTIGSTSGVIKVKATLDSDDTIFDTVVIVIGEPTYGSATALGTAHNNIILIKSFTYTFRTYFKVRESGEFDYSFYYDNVLDTTWWNVAEATANTKGAKFEIVEAFFADGGKVIDGSIVEGTSVPITFNGEKSKIVASGEEFTSDSVRVNVPEGHYLAFTWTIKVSATKAGSVPFTESTFATCYKKSGVCAGQEGAEGFETGNAMFGDQVLVAPNKILYKHPVEKELVFIGDSITQGVSTRKDLYEMWVARVADKLPDTYSVWNLGSGWATAGNLASDGAWLKKAATADEVFICVGVNDLGGNLPLLAYQNLIKSIIEDIRAKNPDCVITLFTVPPFNYSGSQGDTWFAMNEWIRGENIEGVDRYFDFAAVLSQDAPNENYLKDHYMSSASDAHPNGLAGADVAESFINWYYGKSDKVAEVYENYVSVDLGSQYSLPKTVLVKTEGGFLDHRNVTWSGSASTDKAGVTVYTGTVEGTSIQAKFTLRVRNVASIEAVYEVHCANTLNNGLKGTSNSVYDQLFGVDKATGKQWGYVNEGKYATGQFWENNPNKWEGVRCSNTGNNDILYKFELKAGTYTLSLGFKDHWAVTRIMELSVDGVMLDKAMHNGGGAETTKTYSFTVASDKVVEILLHETTNAGANLHWLTISKSSAPSENDMTDARPGDGFVVLEWTGAFAATSYEVWYGTESGNYTNHIVTSEQYAVVSGLTNGTKYYFAVRGVNDEGTGGYSNEMTATPVPVANKKVLYYVDSGNLGLVPLGNQMGVYQSTEDQAYGVDPVTGKQWGYTTDGAPWLSGNPMPENSVLVANNKDIQQLEGKGIHYGFELENGTYTVEITFYDEWRVKDRLTDIYIEQTAVKEGYNGGIGTPETLTFTVKVEDGKLEIDLLGAKGNKDNIMVASIKIIKE